MKPPPTGAKLHLRTFLSVSLDSEELPVALAELGSAQLEREWWEAFLGFAQDHCEVPHLKALLTEVPLGQAEPIAAEQFLQTRTVGLDEARKELETWVEPGQDEIRALEVTTQAVERIDARQVEALIKQGAKIVQVEAETSLLWEFYSTVRTKHHSVRVVESML